MHSISRRKLLCSGLALSAASATNLPAWARAAKAIASSKSFVPAGYKLAWSDEFDGHALDTSKWDYRTDSKCWSIQVPENVSVGDGNLVIALTEVAKDAAKRATVIVPCEDGGGSNGKFSGGGVISKTAFGYGFYEARMRIDAGKGWHSSFWMQKHDGSGGTGPSKADLEFDVIEHDSVDEKSYSVGTIKWRGGRADVSRRRVTTPPLLDFHVYGCEYTPKTVKYFFNGKLVDTSDIATLPQGKVNIWLTSIAASFTNTDKVDTSRLPGHVYFDYVRFYEKA